MQDVLASIDPRLCVQCKAARGLCGIDPCPLLARVESHLPRVRHAPADLTGSSPPSLFVGRHGYPKVGIGPMLPPEHLEPALARDLDDPASWLGRYSIADVVGLRSSLVRTSHVVRVDAPAGRPDRILSLTQELAVAARPVDAEVRLDRPVSFDTSHVGEFTAPHGPVANLKKARLTENVRVERAMERVTSDTHQRAAEGLVDLYRAGTSVYQLERVLSAGMLGVQDHRRLVPTRWSITATDDQLGKHLHEKVRDHKTIDKPLVFEGGAFGNRFLILLLPRVWGYDFTEVWLKGAFWARHAIVPQNDFEDHDGRTSYAAHTAGGYYAARLPILEHLDLERRQATAIVVREIDDEYTTPLGVWVVREAARKALAAKPLVFEETRSALRHMDRRARFKEWQAFAPLLRRLRTQRTLDAFRS